MLEAFARQDNQSLSRETDFGNLELDQDIIDNEILKNQRITVRIHKPNLQFDEHDITEDNIKTLREKYKDKKNMLELIFILRYGNKYLELYIHLGAYDCSTCVFNIPNQEKKPNQTTYLYAAAKKIMQGVADDFETTLQYKLTTPNKKMIAWAKDQDKGRALFDWPEKPKSATMEGNNFVCEIKPRSDECNK